MDELKGQLHAAVRQGNFSLILVPFAFTDPGGGIRVKLETDEVGAWNRAPEGTGYAYKSGLKVGGADSKVW